jgi:hypothetical protein
MNEYQKILSCWHKLEHFSPAAAPALSEVDLLEPEHEPWKIPLKSKDPKKTIEYSVVLGVFDSKVVNDFINHYFNVKEVNENVRNTKICFASIKLDQEGKYINNSLGISSLPWSLGQLEAGKMKNNDWEKAFEDLKSQIFEYIDLQFKQTITNSEGEIEGISRVIEGSQLIALQEKIENLCSWSIKPEKNIYLKRTEKFRSVNTKDSQATSDILNSFYVKDLEKIISSFNEKTVSKAFKQYLDGSLNKQHPNRADISKNPEILKDVLSIKHYSDGCWPSQYTLSLMQQFAINTIFNQLKDDHQSGLFSVNGPPGTGKTTLLRDIIAAIIVNRAKELSKIENPSDAFTKIGEITLNETYNAAIYKPLKSISNGGIVIASSNNGAVENISKELPLKKEIPEAYIYQISYFKEAAEKCISKDNWGIISAVLGNKENRSNLVSSLWFNKDVKDLQKTFKEDKINDLNQWKQIKGDFNNKLSEITKEKERLEAIQKKYIVFEDTQQDINKLSVSIALAQQDYSDIQKKLGIHKALVAELEKRKDKAICELTVIQKSKPHFFVYFLYASKRNTYKKALESALSTYNDTSDNLAAACRILEHLIEKQKATEALLATYNQQKRQLGNVLDSLMGSIEEERKNLKNNYADNDFWKNIETQQSQSSCPWYSKELKQLNSEVFILSLRLHEIFLLTANAASSRVSSTLTGFFNYLKGEKEPSKEEIKAMWDTFFLIIPVVSSTFASIQTMLKDLGQEDIAWLFIDEAGQAVPQAAAGSVWRSKRVGIVGDPFQIEPVVTIPSAITDNISKYFDLNNQQVNSELSVQSMADRINPLGAYLTINSKKEWIGIPLRVHRRCINPMFGIANSIAYDNTMYCSTDLPKSISVRFQTSFIDCKGNVEGKHFVKEQAEIIKDILFDEINHLKDLPDVFVITPFSEVSYKLSSFLFKILINEVSKFKETDSEKISDWLKGHIGTVHTFQGKQAEGVILCLGLDQKTKGAASWASQKPNLLNVALTRAKYRFIAIGDKGIWLSQPYFKELIKLERTL